ncbi:uncharacterized protein J3R85_010476 [Psidium guajava]|nr:uncharacterized protein J3R85_010476 [Psidium guajava]
MLRGRRWEVRDGPRDGVGINRRVLAVRQSNKKCISYETLRRDAEPCQRSGTSYYNCPGGQANQYNRGCAVINRCARNVRDIKT